MKLTIANPNDRLHAAFDTSVSSYREIRGMFVARTAENLCLMLGALLNLGVVSSLGTEAVNAVGMVDPIHQIMQYIYLAFGFCATVFVAQNLGAGRSEMAARSFVQIVRMGALLALVASGLLVAARRPLLQLLYPNADATTQRFAAVYFAGILGTGPLYVMATVVNGMLRAANRPGQAMSISILLNTSWLVCNVLFLRVFRLGIESLAYSVLIARTLTLVYMLRFLVGKSRVMDFCWRKNLERDAALSRRILYAAVPYSLEYLFFQSGKLAVQMIAVQLGSVAATVNTIGLTMMSYLQSPGISMSDTAATIVGRSMGRGDTDNARKYAKSFSTATAVVNLLFFGVVLAAYPATIGLFDTTREVSNQVLVNLLIIGVANVVFWPRGFTLETCLKAAGDMHYATRISTLTVWGVRVVCGYVLSFVCGFGITGIWLAMAVEWGVRAVCFTLRARGEHAFSHRLI